LDNLRLEIATTTARAHPKDFTEAVKWYRKAAANGLKEAQFKLGTCYADGKGVSKDLIESYAYLNLAGATLEQARFNLSLLEKELRFVIGLACSYCASHNLLYIISEYI